MTASTKSRYGDQIDSLMETASEALAHGNYFACERAAAEALQMAFQGEDYERMARILLPLEEARRQKRLAAVDTGRLTILDSSEQLDEPIEAGCFLLEPLLQLPFLHCRHTRTRHRCTGLADATARRSLCRR